MKICVLFYSYKSSCLMDIACSSQTWLKNKKDAVIRCLDQCHSSVPEACMDGTRNETFFAVTAQGWHCWRVWAAPPLAGVSKPSERL